MPTLFPGSVPFVDITNNLVSLITKLNTYPLCKTVPIWWFTNISSKIPGIANFTIKDLKIVIIDLLINIPRFRPFVRNLSTKLLIIMRSSFSHLCGSLNCMYDDSENFVYNSYDMIIYFSVQTTWYYLMPFFVEPTHLTIFNNCDLKVQPLKTRKSEIKNRFGVVKML